MRKLVAVLGVLCLVLAISATAFASTNGTNLIGIGPIARSMGGVGIAAPQDAISAVFANPAAMCFGAYCPGSEFNFAGTLFRPTPEAKVSAGGVNASAHSDEKVYNITFVDAGFDDKEEGMLNKLEQMPGVYGATPEFDADRNFIRMSVRVDKDMPLFRILDVLTRNGMKIGGINTQEPTLEDAFRAIIRGRREEQSRNLRQ